MTSHKPVKQAHDAVPADPRSGLNGPDDERSGSASLRRPRHARGNGGPSFGAPAIVVALALALALLAPASALAGSRAFLRQITGTPTGPGGAVVPFNEPRGITVTKEGDLLVADTFEEGRVFSDLDRFDSAGAFVNTVELKKGLTKPDSLATDSTGNIYVTGKRTLRAEPPFVEVFGATGALLPSAGVFGSREFSGSPAGANVAVDNSTDPFDLSAGSVYVTNSQRPRGIEKFNAKGEPVDFGGATNCEVTKCGYIKGNEITGIPGEGFQSALAPAPTDVAVDNEGNIYALDLTYNGEFSSKPEGAVVEFNPEGVFIRAFTGEENPGLGIYRKGWGITAPVVLVAVAVDPITGQVLVSLEQMGERPVDEGAVDVFEPSGHFVEQITETEPGHLLGPASQMAFDSSGNLYVVAPVKKAVEVYGIHHALPRLTLAEASGRTRTEAVLSGSVDPEGDKLSACSFEYVTEEAFQKEGFTTPSVAECVPGASEVPADSNPHAVHAALNGLTSGVTYRYRLLGTTAGATGGTAQTEPLAFTAPHAPRVDSTSVTNVSSAFADLHAQIDPLGAPTSYHFEYSSDGITWVKTPVTDGEIGQGGTTGSVEASVVQQIGPLLPGTTYTVRVVATSEIEGQAETTLGGTATFTTLSATPEGLPDGRAYELVTPPNKGSAEDMFSQPSLPTFGFVNAYDFGYPSESGDGYLFEAHAGFGAFAGPSQNLYVFRRTGSGWTYTPLASPSLGIQSLAAPVFDPGTLSQVAFFDLSGSTASVGGARSLSLLGSPGGPYSQLSSEAAVVTGVRVNGKIVTPSQVVGASRDLSRVILESPDHSLVPEDETQDEGSQALYEYANGGFTLASIDEQGAPFRCGAELGGKVEAPLLTEVEASSGAQRHAAVSADGAALFFTAPDPHAQNDGPGCWNGPSENTPQLYVRSGGATIEVSAPEAGVTVPANEVHPSVYVGASDDGTKVFFLTETALTRDAQNLHDLELYEYDREAPEGERLRRISAGESGHAAASVVSVPAVSADGSAVYFMADGVLAANRGADGTLAAPGVCERGGGQGSALSLCNLYRYDTVNGSIVYVAQVNDRDVGVASSKPLSPTPELSWYATPDGRYLLFASESDLTGYSTAEAAGSQQNCPENHDFHCKEVYRYSYEPESAAGGRLVCISCDPSGAAPESNAYFAKGASGDAPAGGQVRAISNDGSYAFFDSADPLVAGADNHTQDVYEWEARGRGGCVLARGCVRLISSGADSYPSYFLGMSSYVASGGETVEAGNVFFGTHARLVPQDTDESGDVYDARIGGGFPAPGGKGPCEGNACESPSSAPSDASPGSLTFSGPGNPTPAMPPAAVSKPKPKVKAKPARCKHGFVRKKNKCVKMRRSQKATRAASERRAGR
jgi:hypothetical protein